MNKWILRGLVFAALMVVIRLFQGALINAWQTQSALISIVLLLLYLIGVVLWGVVDGRRDATKNPDPDRRDDLAMVWLLAGLVAGVLSGAVAWLISLFYKSIYTGGLLNEVTTFAAFTALLLFLGGIVGAAIGRRVVDRKAPPVQTHEGAGERAGTDVFSAARGDEGATREAPPGRHEERSAAVATAEREREANTDAIPTTERDEPTEVIRTSERDEPTDVIRTRDADETRPDTRKRD